MKVTYKGLEYSYVAGSGDHQYIDHEWSEEITCDIKDIPIEYTIRIISVE